MIKRFTNLLFALFGGACPLFLHIVNIVENILQLSKRARDMTTQSTKAAILWIFLIQSHEFARGKGEITAEYQEMQHGLEVKHAEITYAEVLAHLTALAVIKKIPTHGGEQTAEDFELGKKQKLATNKLTALNPILKPIAVAWQANGKPQLRDMCGYCNINQSQLIIDSKICKSNTLFGSCNFSDNCCDTQNGNRRGGKKILGLLGKFKDEPEGLNSCFGRQRK